jgi:hypothetical protein
VPPVVVAAGTPAQGDPGTHQVVTFCVEVHRLDLELPRILDLLDLRQRGEVGDRRARGRLVLPLDLLLRLHAPFYTVERKPVSPAVSRYDREQLALVPALLERAVA